MQRRQFLKNGTTLVSLFPFIGSSRLIRPDAQLPPFAEVVKLKVGEYDCMIFRDFQFKYLAKDFFINADPKDLNQSLKKYNVAPENIPSPFIAVLLQHKERKILIDTGIGFSEKPIVFRGASHEFKGQLHHLLRKENIPMEDITDVIITHFHPDHIGGIYSETGQLNFFND